MTPRLISSGLDIWWPLIDGDDTAVGINERPCLWFTFSFLNNPKPMWSVDWDHIDHTTRDGTLHAETIFDSAYEPGDHGYMGGVLVKYSYFTPAPVWRLTGKHSRLNDDDIYEAKWPD